MYTKARKHLTWQAYVLAIALILGIAGCGKSEVEWPRVTVTSPCEGHLWVTGSQQAIAWTSSGVEAVRLELSRDDGATWESISLHACSKLPDSYMWDVTGPYSDECRIRVTDVSSTAITDTSPRFTITPPAIRVISPNGGERWSCQSTRIITWSSAGTTVGVDIHYSIDGGATWQTVVIDAANTGCYAWIIPEEDSSQCIVRVQETGGAGLSDISDGFFTITPSGITVVSPNGGEVWYYGTNKTMTWVSFGVTGNVDIHYSVDSGANWVGIALDTPNSGSYDWVLPNEDSTACLVRVQEAGGLGIFDVSDASFTILPHYTAPLPFFEGFETGTLAGYWSTNSTGAGRVRVEAICSPNTGSYHVLMDSFSDGTYSLNELILTIDLSGRSNVILSFYQKEFGDESEPMPISFTGSYNCDGVAVSADGNTWFRAQDLGAPANSFYQQFIVDLDSVCDTHGISYNSQFKIKFQQYDNYSVITDGFAFDDIAVNAIAQPSYLWTRRMGGASADHGNSVCADAGGNLYVAGNFHGMADFGADFGSTDLKTSAGGQDAFLTRIGADGSYGWTRRTGGAGQDGCLSICTDASGNVYLAGAFQGTVDFAADFGANDARTASAEYNFFITRVNADGTYGWTRRIGASSQYSCKICADSGNSLYVTGYFNGTVDFAADFGQSDPRTSAGSDDVFITKIGVNGCYFWTRRMGGSGSEWGQGICADAGGNVYITGRFANTVNFGSDFGASDTKTSAGNYDIFATKVNADGSYGWTRRLGGADSDGSSGICASGSHSIYVTGTFGSTVNFGLDFGRTDSRTSAGHWDCFITRINSDGSYGWTRRIGAWEWDDGRGICTDMNGCVYVTGWFWDTVDFGADFGLSDTKTSAGGRDVFIVRIGPDGSYGWTRRIGGTDWDYGWGGICTDGAGYLYVTGAFNTMVDFAADFGQSDLGTPMGDYDTFITKILP